MAEFDYDLFVIGGGSGGVRAARLAAQTGARVALAEEYRYGGTCVIRGCVPKKLMVYASQFSEIADHAEGYGWSFDKGRFSWPDFMAHKDAEIARLEGLYHKNLKAAGVELFDTRATLLDPHRVACSNGAEFTAQHILVATGAAPFMPDVPGIEHAISSNEFFELSAMPERVLIVGGGYIACEFAGILNGMGAHVTQFYRRDQILRGFDRDVRDHVAEEMRKKGIALRIQTDVDRIEKTDAGLTVHVDVGGTIEVDAVIYATGRNPNSAGMGLAELGVELAGNGAVKVDDYSQTAVPSIYAIGDVTDRMALTPVAIREGIAFVETVFKSNPTKPDYELVPTAVFTQPEAGVVGLTEGAARDFGPVEIYRTSFRSMYHVLARSDERMLMKIIVQKDTRQVLGVHIVGHGAGDMIQLAGIAVKMGATKEDFDATVAVHPVAAEELVTLRDPVPET
ncbi:glutathione-disulfide reductase [Oceanomicrobium pacificus]|uniref:Glutathione reductase n=1 Tax=Oceanomicrobium pacificus TaxID=2692916 RepID=A0A6B0TWJ8_9RHOB|nr:glutathione-disulfide reductase [Oceanomicrobium pacificus]MXU65534.1 glutathione-disulfide reductase [Oceanomicrobium pacificus]